MFSLAVLKSLQIYGISIVVSMVVAILIKLLVVLTSRAKAPVAKGAAVPQKEVKQPAPAGIPADVVAAIAAAVSVACGPHRILHIGESKRSWANEGRIAQHSSHQPRH